MRSLFKRTGRYLFWWIVNFTAAAAGTLVLVEGLALLATGAPVIL